MRNETVLVAEDSLTVRALLRAHLRDRGYSIVEAADGEQALSRARESLPDVILLDVEMPKLDGFGVLERLKADPDLCDVPVVFITGRTTAEDAVRGLELGAHDYLRKPFEAAELAARVHAALRVKRLQDDLKALNAELAGHASSDGLTALHNRRFLDEQLERLCSRSARHHRPLALLLIDVDHFKRLNDTFGHQGGDEALIKLSRRVAGRMRAGDLLGRWGGDEFMVIAPDLDHEGAAALAEGLRTEIGRRPLSLLDGPPTEVTASIGWATWRGDSAAELVRRADDALFAAKQAGRNWVVGDPGAR